MIGGRLRRLVSIIEELSFTTVRHRLIALLVRLGKAEGTGNGGAITLTLPSNNSKLAVQSVSWCRATSASCSPKNSFRLTTASWKFLR